VLVLVHLSLPLVIVPGWFVGHDITPKLLILIAGCCLALLTVPEWAPGLLLLVRHRTGKIYCGLLGLSVVSLLLSTATSVHPALSLAGTSWRRWGAIPQIAVLLIGAVSAGFIAQNPWRLRGLLSTLILAGTCSAIYAIGQYFGWDPILASNLYTVDAVTRPPGALGHAMYLAAYLLPVTFIALAWAFRSETWFVRAAMVAVGAICILAILLSGTRSAILGLAAGALFMLFSRPAHSNKRTRISFGIAAMVLLAVLPAIYYSPAGASLRIRISQWGEDATGGPRLLVWRDSLSLIRARPVIGYGPETFAAEFRRIESASLSSLYPDYYHESPHNLFVDVAVSQGIFGLLLTGSLLVLTLIASFGRKGEEPGIDSGLRSGFVAMVVALQFMPLTVPVAVLLYSLIGILIALRFPGQNASSVKLRPLQILGLAVLGVALVMSGISYAVQDSTFAGLGRRLAPLDMASIRDEYESLVNLRFPKPGYDLWFSRQLAGAARSASPENLTPLLNLARKASEVAERTSEEPFNALYQSAVLAVAADDLDSAEKKLRTLIPEAPAWYKPHQLLAQLLIVSGRTGDGIEQGRIAADVAGRRRQEVENSIKSLLPQLGTH
jgi:O-antigen ligase